MNDSFYKIYDKFLKAQAEANDRNKVIVFEALAEATITAVTILFDGSDDSGQIEDLVAFTGTDKALIPQTTVKFEEVTYGSSIRQEHHEMPLSDAVENLCYNYLSQFHDGWENNDGAFGEFTFDVVKRTIDFEFNGRHMEYSTDHHTL